MAKKKKPRKKKPKFFFVVRDAETHKEVHRVEVTISKGEHHREKVEMGLMRRMDLERYYLDEETTS